MKFIKKSILFLVTICCFQSCSEKSSQPDSLLKGFMLAGPYVVQSYGGKAAIEKHMGYSRDTSEEETIDLHKKIWIFYFTKAESKLCIETLSNYWDISDKKSLIETLDGLLNEPYEYKAWDYARLVNNAAIGYGAGYLTEAEAQTYVDATLIKAQAAYPNWEAYFNDFNAGRKAWNPSSPDLNEFSRLVADIQKDDNSIYKYLPLKDE